MGSPLLFHKYISRMPGVLLSLALTGLAWLPHSAKCNIKSKIARLTYIFCTHIDLNAWDLECFILWLVCGNVSVDLMPILVPLHTVDCIPAQVIPEMADLLIVSSLVFS